MRALRIHALGEAPRVEELPDPEPAGGEVLVRLEATAIGHHDLDTAAGRLPLQQALPYVPGLEGAGHVVAVGAGVEGVAPGTRVRVHGGGLGGIRPGTWAELVVAPAASVTPVPEELEPALAAAAGSVLNTAWAATFEAGALANGESIGVTGAAGAVGSLVLQLAARDGTHRLVAWTRTPGRLDVAAEAVLPDEDPAEPVDLLVDTVGGPALPRRLGAVRPGGRAVLLGYIGGARIDLSIPELLLADVALLPLNMRRRRVPPEVTTGLLRDVASGKLRVATEVVDLGGIHGAIARLDAGDSAGRVVLSWSG